MPLPGDVVTRYHRLMEQNGYGDAAWAEELQLRMRQQRLTDAGRLLSPVLRPCFVTQRQVDTLAKMATQLSLIFDQLEGQILGSPTLLNRLRMLPAEKSLLSINPGYPHFSMAGSFDASFPEGNFGVSGVDACRPFGVAYASALADVFLELPIIKEFKRNGQKITKVPGTRRASQSVLTAWQQFGGKGKPVVAVVDWANTSSDGISEGELLSKLLVTQGVDAHFVPPEKLVFRNGELTAEELKIDLVWRRILARELLMRWDLNHPLLEAYRARAVCFMNSFRAEIGQRRAFLELLTDERVVASLSVVERKLLKQTVRWTRVVSARKVQRDGKEIELLDWISKNREALVLLPDQPSPELRSYAGSQMTSAAWDFALRQAVRTPYVVQEMGKPASETFPFFQYGEFKLREVDVILQAQMMSGDLGECTALLQGRTAGSLTPLGIAPVLMVA